MPIEYYVGVEGPAITVESAEELYEALDILHTQVMENISDTSPLLSILSQAMDAVQDHF